MKPRKQYWLEKRIEEAEKAVARYKACELTHLERLLVLDSKVLQNTWEESLASLKKELRLLTLNTESK